MLYLALRIALVSHTNRTIRLEAEQAAVRNERGRISQELHDSAKQNVHSIPLMLGSCQQALKNNDLGAARQIMERAAETAQEASRQITRPVWELRAGRGDSELCPSYLMEQTIRDIRRNFPIEVVEEIELSFVELSPESLAAAYRIASEALWNAAEHSGAKTIWLKTSKVETAFMMEIRDEGCGFIYSENGSGFGIPLMERRAAEVAAKLYLNSSPGSGTSIRVRFGQI